MVGYAVSHDESGNWKNIAITLLDADNFEMESYGCSKLKFLYNRDTAVFVPLSAEPMDNVTDTKLLRNIVSRIQKEEVKSASSVSVMWRSFPDSSVEILDKCLCEKVWLSMPHLRDGAHCDIVDVTELFLGKDKVKPLEISIAVYVLNYLVWMSEMKISTVFFDCRIRMYMNCDFLRPLFRIFGTKLFLDGRGERFLQHMKKYLRLNFFKPCISVNTERIVNNIRSNIPDCALYGGGMRNNAVAVGNDLVKRCAGSLLESICNKNDYRCFISELRVHIQRAISEYRVLSEIFVAGENLYRTSDIMYLGLGDFIEVCTFGESLLNLKKTVRSLAECCKVLDGQEIPDIITENGEYIFLKG